MGRFFFWLLIGVIAVLIVLFFPVYLALDAHYDMTRKKFAFMTKAYGFIKLIGGYVATYQGGLAVHISDKKAILIPYTEVEGERKRLSVLRTFRLKTLSITIETGAEYLFLTALTHMLFRAYFLIKGGKKEKLEKIKESYQAHSSYTKAARLYPAACGKCGYSHLRRDGFQ